MKSLLPILFMLLGFQVYAQTKNDPPKPNGTTEKGYRIIYDYKNGTIETFKNGEKVEKLRPIVGRVIQISVKNYNPYSDSIVAAVSFSDRNTEDAAAFKGLIAKNAKLEEKEAEEPQKLDQTLDGTKLKKVKLELDEAYNEAQLMSIDVLEAFVAKTSIKIKSELGVEKVTADQIREKLKDSERNNNAVEDLIASIVVAYKRLISFKVLVAVPVQIQNKDVISITFNNLKNPGIAPLQFDYLIQSGIKIDFSTGIFINGLIDDEYYLKSDDQGAQRITSKDKGNYNLGFGILSHLYSRTGGRVNFGLTTGLLTDAAANLRLLGGGSILLGSESRWVISGGAVFGKAKRLTNGYNVGDAFAGEEAEIPYTDKFSAKWFVGITYNFGGFNIGKK